MEAASPVEVKLFPIFPLLRSTLSQFLFRVLVLHTLATSRLLRCRLNHESNLKLEL